MPTTKYYGVTSLTGGGAGALDVCADGADLNDGDGALAIISGLVYVYRLNATSGAAENSPKVIAPDVNPGTKRWILEHTGVPPGDNTGDVVRYNATLGDWESEAEPISLQGLILTPLASPLSSDLGSIYFNSSDEKIYVSVT